MRSTAVLLLTICLLSSALFAASPTDLEARRKALNDLLHEQWEYTLRTSPTFASILGDKRWNDQLDDGAKKKKKTFARQWRIVNTRRYIHKYIHKSCT